MFSTLIATFVYNLVQASLAQGQQNKAVCRPGFEWMSNSMQQSPCWVTSWLWVPCYGTDFELDPLKPGYLYQGPQDTDAYDSTPCDCNTVVYSTYAACAICQGADIVTWPIYRTNCTKYWNATYPESVPGGTKIPAWAFLDVLQNSTFNVVAAKALADQHVPDSTMGWNASTLTTSNTATNTLPVSVTATNTNPSPLPSAGGEPVGATLKTHGSNVGVVAGASVGGTIGVLLAGALVIFVIRHRRKTERSRSDSNDCSDTTAANSENVLSMYAENVLSPTPMMGAKANMLYDVNDPRTFPPPYRSQTTSPSISSGPATVAQYHAVPSEEMGGVTGLYRGFPQV